MDQMKRTIYAHIFPDRSIYIGQTSQEKLYRRFQYGNGYDKQEELYNRIMFWGWSNIQHTVLECGEMTKEECNRKECEYTLDYVNKGFNVLNKYNTENPCRYRTSKNISYIYYDEDGNEYNTLEEVAKALGRTKQAVSYAIQRNGKCAGKKITRVIKEDK